MEFNKLIVLLGMTLLLCGVAIAEVPPPVMYYDMTDATDEYGNDDMVSTGAALVTTNYPTYNVSGDGSPGTVQSTSENDFNFAPGSFDNMTANNESFTISGWINSTESSGVNRILNIGTDGTPSTDYGYIYFYTTYDNWGEMMRDNTGTASSEGVVNPNMTSNLWYFFALRYNGSHLTSYLSNASGALSLMNTDELANIGHADYDDGWHFQGDGAAGDSPQGHMDDMAFYDYALTYDQLREVFNYGVTGESGAPSLPIDNVTYIDPTPVNNSNWNTFNNISINVSQNCTLGGNSTIYFDTVNPPLQAVAYNVSGLNISNYTADDVYYYYAACTTNSSANTSIQELELDTHAPGFTGTFAPTPAQLINGDFSYFAQAEDANLYNLSLVIRNGSQVFLDLANSTYTEGGDSGRILKIEGTADVSALGMFTGPYNFTAGAWDSHTSENISELPPDKIIKETRKLGFDFTDNLILIETDDDAVFTPVYDFDRYNWTIEYDDKTKKKRTITVTTTLPLKYLETSNYTGHFISGSGPGNWIDFECFDENNTKLIPDEIKKKDDYSQALEYDNLAGVVSCTSVGLLNYNSYNNTFFLDLDPPVVTNLTPVYSQLFNTTRSVTFTYNVTDVYGTISSCELLINGSVVDTEASITEGTNQTFMQVMNNGDYTWAVNCTDNAGNEAGSTASLFSVNFTLPEIGINSITLTPGLALNSTDLQINVNGSYINSSTNISYQYLIFRNGELDKKFYSYYCYQETTNTSTGNYGFCGLDTSGLYSTTGSWTNVANLYDGDYNSAGSSSFPSTLISNYSAPPYHDGGRIIGRYKLTLEDTVNYNQTFNESYIIGGQLVSNIAVSNTQAVVRLWNGAILEEVLSDTTVTLGSTLLYDEAVLWNVPGSADQINSNEIYNLDNISALNTSVGDEFIVSVRAYHPNANYSDWTNSSVTTIANIIIDNCTASNNVTLNFTIFDENNLTRLPVDVSGTFYYTGDNVTFYNYTASWQDVDTFSVCIYPREAVITLDAYLNYEAENGVKERYYLDKITVTNETQQINLYNFNDTSNLEEIKIIGYNYYYQPYTNVIGQLQRYYPAEAVWRTVQIDQADDEGVLYYYIYERTTDYRIIWVYNGFVLDRTQNVKFNCPSDISAEECEQAFTIQDPAESLSNYGGLTFGGSYDNVTGIYSFTWTDANNVISTIRLIVEKQTLAGATTICDTTVASASGTINCNVSGYTGQLVVRAIRTASPGDPFFHDIINKAIATLGKILEDRGLAKDGEFMGAMIMITAAGFGAISPVITILISVAGLIFLFAFGLANVITLAFVISGVALGVIVAFIVKK